MQTLPDAVIQADPALCLSYAWALALNGQPDEADAYLQLAEEAFRDNPEQYGAVLSAQIHLARIRHDLPQTISLSRRALSLIPVSRLTTHAARFRSIWVLPTGKTAKLRTLKQHFLSRAGIGPSWPRIIMSGCWQSVFWAWSRRRKDNCARQRPFAASGA